MVLQLLWMGELLPTDYVNILGNQVHPMDHTLFLNNDTICPYMQPEVFSLGLRSMKMHSNIFPGQHNYQT